MIKYDNPRTDCLSSCIVKVAFKQHKDTLNVFTFYWSENHPQTHSKQRSSK